MESQGHAGLWTGRMWPVVFLPCLIGGLCPVFVTLSSHRKALPLPCDIRRPVTKEGWVDRTLELWVQAGV